MQQNPLVDPIRTNYFDIIEKVDAIATILFVVGAVLSIASTLIPEAQYKLMLTWVQCIFFVIVLVLCALDLTVKLYLSPRAAQARVQDFLSHAYGHDLSSNRTSGYYNNGATSPTHKIAAQVFENTLFTTAICSRMLVREIPFVLVYFIVFSIGMANRDTSITVWSAVAQVLFSEQVLVRFVRIGWLRKRSDEIHEELRRLYISKSTGSRFDAMAMDALTRHEIYKSTAGLTLSSKVYKTLNPSLSAQWDQLRKTYSIP